MLCDVKFTAMEVPALWIAVHLEAHLSSTLESCEAPEEGPSRKPRYSAHDAMVKSRQFGKCLRSHAFGLLHNGVEGGLELWHQNTFDSFQTKIGQCSAC